MSILISSFPHGGSTFTLRAMITYLESVYGENNVKSVNEPETSGLKSPPSWTLKDPLNKHFSEIIKLYETKQEVLPSNLIELLEIPGFNTILKTNFYTRILNYTYLPDTIFYMFVIRCPFKWIVSLGRYDTYRNIMYYSLKNRMITNNYKEDNIDLWLEITEEIVTFIRKLPESRYVVLNYYEYVNTPEFLETLMNEKLGITGKMPEYNKIQYKTRYSLKQEWTDFPDNFFYRYHDVVKRFYELGFNTKMIESYKQKYADLQRFPPYD